MSTKAIQDRIYRSRLTINYRTNIDGVTAPQALPFRLLVLGNFTGLRSDAPRLEDRKVVTIRKGTRLEDVMRDMGVRLDVPRDKSGPRAALGRGLAIEGDVRKPDGGEPLLGDLAAIDDQGECAIRGDVQFSTKVQDNGRERDLRGKLRATGTAKLAVKVTNPEAPLPLKGICEAPVEGQDKAASVALVDPRAEQVTFAVSGPSLAIFNQALAGANADADAAKVWKTFRYTGTLSGTIATTDADRGVASVAGLLTLSDQATGAEKVADRALPKLLGKAQIAVTRDPRALEGSPATLRVKSAGVVLDKAKALLTRPKVKLTIGADSDPTAEVLASSAAATVSITVDGKEITGVASGTLRRVRPDSNATPPTAARVRGVITITGDKGSFGVYVDAADPLSGALLTKDDFEPTDAEITAVAQKLALGEVDLAVGPALFTESDVTVSTSGRATLSGAVKGAVKGELKVAGLTASSTGPVELAGTIKVGPTDVLVTAGANIVAGSTWRLATPAPAVTVEVKDKLPIEVVVAKADGKDPSTQDLLKLPLKVIRRGDLELALKSDDKVDLKSKDPEWAFASKGRLAPKALNIASLDGGPTKLAFDCTIGDSIAFELTGSGPKLDLWAKRVEVSAAGAFGEGPAEGDIFSSLNTGRVAQGDGQSDGTQRFDDQRVTVASNVLKIDVSGKIMGARTMPFTNLAGFTPDAVSASIPELRRLRVITWVLQDLKEDINRSVSLRSSIARALSTYCDPDFRGQGRLPVLLSKFSRQYGALRVDAPGAAPDDDQPVRLEELSDDDQQRQEGWFASEYFDIIRGFFKSLELPAPKSDSWKENAVVVSRPVPGSETFDFHYREAAVSDDYTRFQNAMAALILNGRALEQVSPNTLADRIDEIIKAAEQRITEHLRFVLHHDAFRELESNWRSVAELVAQVEDDKVYIDLLDVTKEELATDLGDHQNDIFTSALFRKVYVEEYDRFGGQPFSAMIGLYRFDSSDEDVVSWLTPMAQIANAAHCPFISSVGPKFFGDDIQTWDDLKWIGDIEAHLTKPRFGKWNELRASLEAPYLGLTLPGYLLRRPWRAGADQLGNRTIDLDEVEEKAQHDQGEYLWGNAAVLFARNMIRSFEQSGWCQYIRGVKGGGLLQGLTVNVIKRHGQEELQSPLEFDSADYRELQFSKSGLIPLLHSKGTADAAFFSTQSLKQPQDFMSELDTQNSYLVTNLAYTLSITRIAHYVKRMMRDYIGSSLDAAYIQNTLQLWLDDYVTTAVNPDDLTLRYYPFKAVAVSVANKPGPLGWFKAVVSVLPHVQFEGMDVELRLEAALGGAK